MSKKRSIWILRSRISLPVRLVLEYIQVYTWEREREGERGSYKEVYNVYNLYYTLYKYACIKLHNMAYRNPYIIDNNYFDRKLIMERIIDAHRIKKREEQMMNRLQLLKWQINKIVIYSTHSSFVSIQYAESMQIRALQRLFIE